MTARAAKASRPRAGSRRARAVAPAAPAAATPASRRLVAVDALRGLAIAAMIAYHFAFDLRFFGVTRSDFEHDPFWLGARAAIVTSFLLVVGVSLVLAREAATGERASWRRVALIAACALAASAGSWLLFPRTFIWFGILHCIAVASVLARPLASRPIAAAALGVAIVVAGLALRHPAFDTPWLAWIGFTTVKPATEDYVPLFPWLGVVLTGIGLGHVLVANRFHAIAPLARAPSPLAWLGRHSLAVYMVHQPILIGALWLVVR